MKRIITLVLLIILPIGLIISESSKEPLLKRIEQDGYSKVEKDSLWEYVKYQVEKGKINQKIKYGEKFQEPILLSVQKATVKDSLAVEALMQELKTVFPLKKIIYFEDYIGTDFQSYQYNTNKLSLTGKSKDEVLSYTFFLSFDENLENPRSAKSSYNLNDTQLDYGKPRSNEWNMNYMITELSFGFDKNISIHERERCISEKFFNVFWEIYNKNVVTQSPIRSDYRSDFTTFIIYSQETSLSTTAEGLIKDDKFLIEKLFSNDFNKQFENYMFKTYPWRYATIFINNEKAKQNANVIIGFIGLLILILSCSLFWNRERDYAFSSYFWPVLIYIMSFSSLSKLYTYLIYIDQTNNFVVGLLTSFLFEILLALIISVLFWQIEKRIARNIESFGYHLITKLGLTLIFLYSPYLIFYFLGDNLNGGEVNQSLNDLQFLFLAVSLTLARGLLIYLNHFSENLVKQKDVELSHLKEVNAQSELKLLQSHINPHFLYNALNSIASLAHDDADKTEKMALSLSDLFRYSINKKGDNMSTISEEVTLVENYLEIEKIRFGERLVFELTVDEDVKDERIPMFMLQPLIENAIKHGVSKIGGDAKISLDIKNDHDGLLITVSDNGPEFPKGLVSGHGLQTVYDLLRLSYGDNASLSWENEPKKQIVIAIKSTSVVKRP